MLPTADAALLFDIDGTLADTDRLHLEAFNRVFEPLGQTFSAERFKAELQGFSLASITTRFLAGLSPEQQRAVMDEKEATFRALAAGGIAPLPGLLALLDRADAAGLRFVAVTNAPRANALMILDAIGIRDRFQSIIFGDELEHGKPHPLPYLEGLSRLGARAERSVAFEDSISGVQAASRAGIATIGLLTGQSSYKLREAGAVFTAHDYTDSALLNFVRNIVGGGSLGHSD